MSTDRRPIRPALLLGLVAALSSAPAAQGAEDVRVILRGLGAEVKSPTPLVIEAPERLPEGPAILKGPGSGEPLPIDVFQDGGKTYLGLIVGKLDADETIEYALSPRPEKKPLVSISGSPSGPRPIELRGDLLTEYRQAETKPILFPVVGPDGVLMTRSYPMKDVQGEDRDHPHQRSFWFTHGDVNGLDFWGSDPLNRPTAKSGTIRQTAQLTATSGDAVALLRTKNDWLGPDGKKVCEDERVLRFYGIDSPRIIDFDIVLKATAGPVTFGDTKEGSFGLRVASSMDVKRKEGGRITNAEGITDNDAWGKPSPWVDYTGPVAGRTVGVAILNHPDSFRYPTTWHVRDYGLFAANPFGWHDFGLGKSGAYTIPEGQSISLRYRVILHKGDTASAAIADAFKAYANPPKVEIHAD